MQKDFAAIAVKRAALERTRAIYEIERLFLPFSR